MNDNDKLLMALDEAKKAYELDEIPVGCVIFREDEIVGCGYNRKESESNAILHAEIIAIDEACRKLGTWRLEECCLYVTLKPCMMCMGAIMESRIKKVYYGTENNSEQMYDLNKVSRLISLYNLENNDCSRILSDFFKKKRKK
ncbi:MAG: nucleoside deaminase [Bacilli bacterium]